MASFVARRHSKKRLRNYNESPDSLPIAGAVHARPYAAAALLSTHLIMSRFRVFVLALLACGAARAQPSRPAVQSFRLEEATLAETQAALRSGRLTCHRLVQQYLDRVAAYDQSTHLNAVVVLNSAALSEADTLDKQFTRTHKMLPLHCAVLAIKDNYDTRGLQTTGGSIALKGFAPDTDAFMVARLRNAGAIVLFKSNMAEWAFSPVVTESSIGGVTRNPYDLERVPAGSSGGTGASVAANFAFAGLGTDTGDSIRGPASHNALVGIRPTMGLTSRDGIVPLNLMADVGGPLARTVADTAALLTVLAGYDAADPVTKLAEGHTHDYSKSLRRDGLRGARIGVLRRYLETSTTDPEVRALTEKAIADLRALGAVVVDPFDIPHYDELVKDIGCGDFQADVDQWFTRHAGNAPFHSISAIHDSGLYLPYIQARLEKALQSSHEVCQDTWHDPKKVAFRKSLLDAMDAEHLDAILYPTWGNAPRLIGDLKSPGGDNNQVISPMTGLPAITVPMGYTHGNLPAGLQLLGRAFAEEDLLRFAYAYEQATHHRHAPTAFPELLHETTERTSMRRAACSRGATCP
jgi:Asp-tRNA(Asn)/Glu-tRNA(Gln) amidotransferase A subunit family amidase